MRGIYFLTFLILVSEVWRTHQWKPKWINVIKLHVIFHVFVALLMGSFQAHSGLYLQTAHHQADKYSIENPPLHRDGSKGQLTPKGSHLCHCILLHQFL